ncbi:hypothetical protein BX600DRAFT_443350 [Xylariales sp. PMI_506]|nr:hypothetical protein BX600DRAFT_443350 [Xylariales sp. PMI_506]
MTNFATLFQALFAASAVLQTAQAVPVFPTFPVLPTGALSTGIPFKAVPTGVAPPHGEQPPFPIHNIADRDVRQPGGPMKPTGLVGPGGPAKPTGFVNPGGAMKPTGAISSGFPLSTGGVVVPNTPILPRH